MAAPAERMEVRSYNAVNASVSPWFATDAYFFFIMEGKMLKMFTLSKMTGVIII